MNFIKLLPAILSILLHSAHFLRAKLFFLVLIAVIMLLLLLIRRPWSARLVQIFLVIGGFEWVRTLVILAKMRQAEGGPWMRLAIILGGVAVFTICSALVFRFKSLRERYKLA
ncbi:MAG: hypothetical protein HY806_02320 [Nitrospirae bacterium]|nr:hypothetical protein [Nitrospirota bacterium]MBI4837982.1 hypothetical protein [Nitrospirota bacterium]